MDQSYINMIFTVVMTIITGSISMFGYFVKEWNAETERRIQKSEDNDALQNIKADKIQEKFNAEILRIQREFVTRDEYITSMTKIDKKLDQLLTCIHKVDKQLAGQIAKGEADE